MAREETRVRALDASGKTVSDQLVRDDPATALADLASNGATARVVLYKHQPGWMAQPPANLPEDSRTWFVDPSRPPTVIPQLGPRRDLVFSSAITTTPDGRQIEQRILSKHPAGVIRRGRGRGQATITPSP